jgi:hypothetical protein
MTIREAALAWGVSELTVRRRIKDGKLISRLDNGKYFVREGSVREGPAPADSQAATEDAPESPAITEAGIQTQPSRPSINLDALVAEHRRLAEQAGRAALLEEQLRTLEARYARLEEGTVTLANRNGWLESKLDERDREIKLLQDSRRRPSLWKRLLGSS